MSWEIWRGDSRLKLPLIGDASVDAVVCDPPYELGFLGREWDSTGVAYDADLWREVLRALKPGGHLLAFGGTRTYHRMACAIEDAGFEIRDSIHWIYGSGFPKSHDVSKAIDKAAGAARQVIGVHRMPGYALANVLHGAQNRETLAFAKTSDEPATEAARQWVGWGTALKPAHEPCVVARKPLEGTVAANVLAHGTGAINVDGCRVPHANAEDLAKHAAGVAAIKARGGTMANSWANSSDLAGANDVSAHGRWPANVVLDEDAGRELNEQSGLQAARFFYCAKASKAERGEGNTHPTVKPIALMRWLVRLVTPPGGLVLDPFAGSGSTGVAAIREGCSFVGIERDVEAARIARKRLRDEKGEGKR